MDTLTDIWEWFTSFPAALAIGAQNVVIVIHVVTALVIVFWRRSPRLTIVSLMVPLGLYGVAWLVRLGAEWETVSGSALTSIAWIVFSVLMLVSLVWSVVNLIRVLVNK